MIFRNLGHSEIKVSLICLGSMNWGEQNTQDDAFEQLDYAISKEVNFIDTAEMYPIPPKKDTFTNTETIIGNWLKARNNRAKIILATKITGPALWANWIRDGKSSFNKANLNSAVDASLKRLQTDYIDLYQLHWPERKTNYFGQRGYKAAANENSFDLFETINVLHDLIKQGKIRNYGLSNETSWGISQFLKIADDNNFIRPVSVQNPYSLLNRIYEVGNAEISHRENIGLLAYSPLAFGTLSGKYLNGKKPAGARLTLYGSHFPRYLSKNCTLAVEKYVKVAESIKISPASLALAFVNCRKFITSNIIGATSIQQLKENIDSINISLDKNILKAINEIQADIPNPAP